MVAGKTAVLFMSSVVALAGIGASYACWYDDLYVDGTIETGDLEWVIEWYHISDDNDIDWNCGDGFENPLPHEVDKDVGYMTATLSDDKKTLDVLFHNTYPMYYGHVTFWVHNVGTIPLHIDHVNLYEEGELVGTFTENFLHVFDDDYEILYGDSFGMQLHPCEYAELSFSFHLRQPAEQDTIYHFTIEVVASQWNEGNFPGVR